MIYNLQFITKIANYLWRLWFVVLAAAASLVFGAPIYFFSLQKKNYNKCYYFTRLWCIFVFYAMGFRIKLTKNEVLKPDEKYIIISNHTSLIDPLLMVVLHKKHALAFVAKKELEKIPIIGQVLKQICIMVDRKDPQSRADVYVQATEKLKEGKNIVIFPEGGVKDYPTETLEPFKDGAFKIAEQNGVPIAVYTFIGLREMFPFIKSEGHPGVVKVYLNEILEPKHDKNHTKNYAFNLIKQTLETN